MGRTVINETENKQTVILNDSPEGVEGGYFDSLMEWHELKSEAVKTLFDTDADCSIFPFVMATKTSVGAYYNAYQNFANNRRFIATMKGDHPLPWSRDNGSTFETSELYPIKLPANVKSITITMKPAFESQIHVLYWDGEKYLTEKNSTWLNSGGSLSLDETDHDLYMVADLRRNSSNAIFSDWNTWEGFPHAVEFNVEV